MRRDRKNGVATHARDRDHRVEARVIQIEPFHWKRRVYTGSTVDQKPWYNQQPRPWSYSESIMDSIL